MSMMDATPERAQAVDFPKTPLLFYSLAVLARDDLPVTTWADLDKPAGASPCRSRAAWTSSSPRT